MAKIAGRKIRWEYSANGTTWVVLGGSTSDGLTFTQEFINATDKDDVGARTFVDDGEFASTAVDGTVELHYDTSSETLIDTLFADNTNSKLLHLRMTVDADFRITGRFGVTSLGITGAEGAETGKVNLAIASSGATTKADVT